MEIFLITIPPVATRGHISVTTSYVATSGISIATAPPLVSFLILVMILVISFKILVAKGISLLVLLLVAILQIIICLLLCGDICLKVACYGYQAYIPNLIILLLGGLFLLKLH